MYIFEIILYYQFCINFNVINRNICGLLFLLEQLVLSSKQLVLQDTKSIFRF